MFRIKMADEPPPPPMGDMAPPAGGGPDPSALMGQDDASSDPGMMDDGQDQGKVDQSISGYMGPEFGPFHCAGCVHYQDPGKCDIVKGAIDPEGCCNLYEPSHDHASNAGPGLEEGSPEEEASEPQDEAQAEGDVNGY